MGYSIFMQAEIVMWHIAKLVACTVNLFFPLQPATTVFYVRNEHSILGVAVQQWIWHNSFKMLKKFYENLQKSSHKNRLVRLQILKSIRIKMR